MRQALPVDRPPVAIVPRRPPGPGKTGLRAPAHAFDTAAPMIDMGDPFNIRNVVRYGDFYHVGKIRSDPGHHVNIYTAIPEIHAVMQPFFGFITKLRYLRQPNRLVRGRMRPLGQDVNVERPPVATMGDFATYTTGVIHTSTRG